MQAKFQTVENNTGERVDVEVFISEVTENTGLMVVIGDKELLMMPHDAQALARLLLPWAQPSLGAKK